MRGLPRHIPSVADGGTAMRRSCVAKPRRHRLLRVFLALALAFTCTMQPKRAEAFVPAVPLAGAGITALAAEMGISVEALTLAFGALVATGTGLYLANSTATTANSGLWGGDVTDNGYEWNWNDKWQDGSQDLPGFDTWGDLTDEERTAYGNPRAYTQSQWAAWLAQNGLLADDGNGNYEPTEPPEDPNKREGWYKLRNAVTALASDGTVALGASADAVMLMLANGAAGIFANNNKTPESGLGLTYERTSEIDGIDVQFRAMTATNYGTTNVTVNSDAWIDGLYNPTLDSYMYLQSTTSVLYPSVTFVKDSGSYKSSTAIRRSGVSVRPGGTTTVAQSGTNVRVPGTAAKPNVLNINYQGQYIFPNGVKIQNGVNVGSTQVDLTNGQYGQMEGTPDGLANNIYNNTAYNNYFDNVNNGLPDGNQYTVTVPENYGKPEYQPNYNDYVKTSPDTAVTPLPGDSLITPSDVVNPNPNPNPEPDPESTFEEKVNALLRQPLSQAFPFCLMVDLQRFSEKVEAAVESGAERENVLLPTSEFEAPGINSIELKGKPLKDFGNMVRPYVDILIIATVIVATFAFFLKRGGE